MVAGAAEVLGPVEDAGGRGVGSEEVWVYGGDERVCYGVGVGEVCWGEGDVKGWGALSLIC
jgi:hypothetical protein